MAGFCVFGTYAMKEQLEDALAILQNAGFRDTDTSVLVPETVGNKEIEAMEDEGGHPAEVGSDLPVGGPFETLAGAGTLMIKGVGNALVSGPVFTRLTRAPEGTAVATVTGLLVGVGLPAYQAKHYESQLRHGCILTAIHADDQRWVQRAKQVLKGTGAQNISEADEASGAFAQSERVDLRKAS